MDILQLLVWLSGAGISAVSAFVLERLSGFQQLSSSAKSLIAVTVATLIAIAAMWTHDYFLTNPLELVAMNPYLQIVIAAASIIIQQVAHSIQRGEGRNG
jgi:branched-subunit amino acid ABC-type transport system permease component